jgi:hypothetical protein
MVSAPHSDLALLNTLLERGLPAELPASDLAAWFNQPHIQSALASLKSLADSAAALRRARARFTAIDALDHLCQSDPNPTTRLRAAIALLRPHNEARHSANQVPKAPTDQGAPARAPLPEGGTGVGSASLPTTETGPFELEPQHSEPFPAGGASVAPDSPPPAEAGNSSLINRHPEPLPEGGAGVGSVSPPPAPTGRPTTQPPNFEISDFRSEIPPRSPGSPHSLLDLLQTLTDDEEDLDPDFDDADDPDAAQDAAEDAAADRHAAAIEAHLGVPITHPEILKAISELRIHDLDAIAAKIRDETNGSTSPPDPRATGPGPKANLSGHSRSPPD